MCVFYGDEKNVEIVSSLRCSSDRRYIVQRYFEHELSRIKSPEIETKWRHCLFLILSQSLPSLFLTRSELDLMHEIFSWHMNSSPQSLHFHDYLIDFEDLLDTFHSHSPHNEQTFLHRPVTTLVDARKNIELWTKSSTKNFSDDSSLSFFTSSTGWIQIDSKLMPYIQKYCDRLLPVEYLLHEHVITSSEDCSLRSHYIPSTSTDIQLFRNLFRDLWLVPDRISLITLDHLIFRLKRLFFIRFISSPDRFDPFDYSRLMSYHGGLLTFVNSPQQRLPFITLDQQNYVPQLNEKSFPSSISTFSMASKDEFEYLRFIALYDYLSSEDNHENLRKLFSINGNLRLIPVEFYFPKQSFTSISLKDFHFHEYQRRTQQEQILISYDDSPSSSATGWWQTPKSSQRKRSFSHLKYQRSIFF